MPNSNDRIQQNSFLVPHTSGHALKIVLAGEGGQGIQSIAKILSRSAFDYGYHASFIPNFGTEQRGGLSLAYIQFSKVDIISPKFKTANLFVITSNRDIDRTLQYIGSTTNVLYDADLLKADSVQKLSRLTPNLVPIKAFFEATHKYAEKSFNIIVLGILTGLIDPGMKDVILKTMAEKFEKYYKQNVKLRIENELAFNLGLTMTSHS